MFVDQNTQHSKVDNSKNFNNIPARYFVNISKFILKIT